MKLLFQNIKMIYCNHTKQDVKIVALKSMKFKILLKLAVPSEVMYCHMYRNERVKE